jgi:VCBS repeat-containing protein
MSSLTFAIQVGEKYAANNQLPQLESAVRTAGWATDAIENWLNDPNVNPAIKGAALVAGIAVAGFTAEALLDAMVVAGITGALADAIFLVYAEIVQTKVGEITVASLQGAVNLFDGLASQAPTAPIAVSSVESAVAIQADQTPATGIEHASGVIGFSNAVPAQQFEYNLIATYEGQGSPLGSLAIANASILVPSNGASSGNIWWQYNVSDAALSGLQDGQTIVETWSVTIDDGRGDTFVQPMSFLISRPPDQTSISTVGSHGEIVVDGSALSKALAGAITFTDADKVDIHTASFVFDQAHSDQAAPLGTFTINLSSDTTGTGTGGQVDWTYNVPDAVLNALNDGEVIHETYTVSVADGHGGVQNTSVLVTISRANLLSAENPTALSPVVVTQGQNPGGTDSGMGSDAFADGNHLNTHQVDWSFLGSDYASAPLGTFDAVLVTDASGAETGQISWTYTVSDAAIQSLAAGQVVHETFRVIVADGHGGTVSEIVPVNIVGINDPVVIASSDKSFTGSIAENPNATGNTAIHQLSGTVHFADPDLIDRPAVTFSDDFVYTDASGNVLTLGASQEAILLSDFSLVSDPNNTNNGSAIWTFSPHDNDLDFLGQGETLVANFHVNVSDRNGGTDRALVAITVTGANDAPIFQTGKTVGSVMEGAGASGSSALDRTDGTIFFKDADLRDTHAISWSYSGASLSNGGALPDSVVATLKNAFSIEPHDSTGSGAGSVDWAFSTADGNLDFLAAGQSLSATYNVTIDDGHGGTLVQPVVITAIGSNDAPTMTGGTLIGSVDDQSRVSQGAINFADPDLIDTHSIVSVKMISSDSTYAGGAALGKLTATVAHDTLGTGSGGEIDWTYNLNNPALGTPTHEVWAVTLQDSSGAKLTENVTVTIAQTAAQVSFPTGFYVQEYAFNGENNGGLAAYFHAVFNPGWGNGLTYQYKIVGSDPLYYVSGLDTLRVGVSQLHWATDNNHVLTIDAIPYSGAGYQNAPKYEFQFVVPIFDPQPTKTIIATIDPSTIHVLS